MTRKIIHIDMDAFYASVEQRDCPALKGKPVAVGLGEARGVVSAASYEARKFGVRSAMPSLTAKARCPELIFVPPRFDVYHDVSRQIRNIFLEYTDLVEPLSLDEAFLDVTSNHKNIQSAIAVAREIKKQIREETNLTASAGISINKFLAKIASDIRKPDGLYVILPDEVEDFVEKLPIEKFFGVGKVTAEKMHQYGIQTGADLKRFTESGLVKLFGKAGHQYYYYARGVDERAVEPERVRKSVGAETTFENDIDHFLTLMVELYYVARKVWERIENEKFKGRTVTLKIKYSDFKITTKSKTLPETIVDFNVFWNMSKSMLKQIDISQKKIRLIGLTISRIDEIQENNLQLKMNFSF